MDSYRLVEMHIFHSRMAERHKAAVLMQATPIRMQRTLRLTAKALGEAFALADSSFEVFRKPPSLLDRSAGACDAYGLPQPAH